MSNKVWLNFIRSIARDADRASRCLVLTAASEPADVAQAEVVLGRPVPLIARAVLQRWKKEGIHVLLDTVPQLLNPGIDADKLNPAGTTMNELFPTFCALLEHTEDLAVIIDVAKQGELLVAGAADQTPPPGHRWSFSPDGQRMWAYYLPRSLDELSKCESQLQIRLSPQMRQLYTRAWGAPDEGVCPYFYRPEMLIKGALYTELYSEIADQALLAESVIERQKTFVSLNDTALGNSVGFFADEQRQDGEYTIYLWDHEAADFEEWTPDFAGAVTRFLADW